VSWGNEGWRQAAHDYHAGRAHNAGRHQRITHMDFEPEAPEARVIGLGNQRDEQGEARPPAFSDDALALRFIDQHKDSLRYVPSLGKWLRWDGKRWCFDDRLIAYDRMRKVCRAAAAECNQPKLDRGLHGLAGAS
jgi:phage/plasmid-associated DNA primase